MTREQIEPTIIVMAKAPRAGVVKTRLRPALTDSEAAQLAACFVQDIVATARQITTRVLIAYAPADGRAHLESLLPAGLEWVAQQGDDLGERMMAAFLHTHTHNLMVGNGGPLLMIGTDSPTLPPAFLLEAARALTTLSRDRNTPCDLTLGPTEDGGYYLIGMCQPNPALLRGVAWSTAEVYRQTAANAAQLGLRVHRLPPWYDVDMPEDLLRLRAELAAAPETAARAPQTCAWLHANRPR